MSQAAVSPKALKLNPKQKEAATHVDGPMMVLAGPGTGKTQIIAARIANLLTVTQMEPHNILCLTFTESGVVAMRNRLLSMIGVAAYSVRIHTFHSFCNDVIKENPEHFLRSRDLSSLPDIEKVRLIRKLIDTLPTKSPLRPFGSPYFYEKAIAGHIQTLKRENISPQDFSSKLSEIEEFLEEKSPVITSFTSLHANKITEQHATLMEEQLYKTPLEFCFEGLDLAEKKQRTVLKNTLKKEQLKMLSQIEKQKALCQLYEAYELEMQKRGFYDYEDMILWVLRAFAENSNLLAKYQEQFQYILADEYQDSNGAQNELLSMLGSFDDSPNLFVVGDDKQSIYRFQGASLENIVNFHARYKGKLKLLALEENYRSQQYVLDAALSMVQNNQDSLMRFIPSLKTHLTAKADHPQQPVEITKYSRAESELYHLALKIQQLIKQGTHASEIAVLYRSNYEADEIKNILEKLNIPSRVEVGVNILESRPIVQFLDLLKLISLPDLSDTGQEDALLFKVMHFKALNLNQIELLKLTRAASKSKESILELALKTPAFAEFTRLLLSWRSFKTERSLLELMEVVLGESGFLKQIMESDEKLSQLSQFTALFDAAKNMARTRPLLTLEEFLEDIELHKQYGLAIKESPLSSKEGHVRLMTAHRSKGLEFDHVFLPSCVDRKWGGKRNFKTLSLPKTLLKTASANAEIQDERRLFFVALTRARKQVHLSYASESEQGRSLAPSRFLSEMNPEKVKEISFEENPESELDRFTLALSPVLSQPSKNETDFVKSLLKNYTLSVTHLSNYLKCPRLFYYRNLIRVPSVRNKHAALGSAIHSALYLGNEAARKGDPPSEEFLIHAFEKAMQKQILSPRDRREGLEYGKETLKDYFKNYESSFHDRVKAEFDFASHGVNLDGIPLTGKLDRIEILDEVSKKVHVVDYKTGSPDSKSQQLKPGGDYHMQIVFYKLLCDLSTQFPYTMSSGEIQFVERSKREKAFKRVTYEITKEQLEQLKTTIKDVYADIMNLRFLNPDPMETCQECEYCEMHMS